MSFLSELNDRQREAAEALKGPVLIVAGAGSGKTRTLTVRVANLIARGLAQPWQILAVTFTNKAAEEMKKRLGVLLKQHFELNDSNQPTIGTFHSVCGRILRRHFGLLGRETSFVIYDSDDTQRLIKRVMQELSIDDDRFNPRAVLAAISRAKNELHSADHFKAHAGNYFEKMVATIYTEYSNRLVRNNAIDFDDMLFFTVKLFREHPDLLDQVQERWRFICIDEYQDTNHAQYMLVKLLAAKYRNLCVIGDSDQSIYAFRGANIGNILDFEKDYPEATIVKLEQNYRSTQNILDAADAVIAVNKNRPQKKMWTEAAAGEPIRVFHCRSEEDEAHKIADEIEKLRTKDQIPLKEMVILYRTNVQSRVLEEALLRRGIPYKVIGGVKFYARREIKDLLAYLRVILNPRDTDSLLRVINVPLRGIGATTVNKLQAFALERSLTLAELMDHVAMVSELSDRQRGALAGFWAKMTAWRQVAREKVVSEILRMIVKETDYKGHLLDGTEEGEMRLENVLEFIAVSEKYDGLPAEISLQSFLEEVALVADTDQLDPDADALTLMTLHSVKGLEYPIVFIAGCEENIFPHSRSLMDEMQMEEERRLMYVGCTRAMKKLHLFAAKTRHVFGDFQQNALSRFIRDIPEHLVTVAGDAPLAASDEEADYDFPVHTIPSKETPLRQTAADRFRDGDRVRHTTFGEGVIVERRGDLVTIAFKDRIAGIKKFAANIAPIEKL